jgi:hypothetical protein
MDFMLYNVDKSFVKHMTVSSDSFPVKHIYLICSVFIYFVGLIILLSSR